MSIMIEARGAGRRTQASETVFVGTIDSSEYRTTIEQKQAQRIARRFGVSFPVAVVLAELAFRTEAVR